MGGAERNARKKRQAQSTGRGAQTTGRGSAVAAARRADGDHKKVIIGVVVVVVLAAAVIGGVVFYNNSKNATEGQDIKAAVPSSSAVEADNSLSKPSYPVARQDGVVLVGRPTAKVTLDVYEDFLCPICGQFEKAYGSDVEKYVEQGTVAVRYHMLPLLNTKSDPPGYSMDSANAGLCAADAGVFPAFHKSLFEDQPEEGSRGWDSQQLAALGKKLGVTDSSFSSCVTSGKYNDVVRSNFDQVQKAPYLQQDFGNGQKGFGTPTVAVDEKVVDTSQSNWLDKLVASVD